MVSFCFLHCPLRILWSLEFQTSKLFNVGHFEPDITDFVKNLWRGMTPSQNWILKSEHELSTSEHRLSTSKHRLSTSKHEQILKFSDFECFEPDITDFVKNLWRRVTPPQNRLLGSPKFTNSKFVDLGHFHADITNFVKNLWREMTPSQNWILGSDGHSQACTSKHRLSTS